MKPAKRLDALIYPVRHYLYEEDGSPKRFVQVLPVELYGDNHAYHALDLQVSREVILDANGKIATDSDGGHLFGPYIEVAFVGRGKIWVLTAIQ